MEEQQNSTTEKDTATVVVDESGKDNTNRRAGVDPSQEVTHGLGSGDMTSEEFSLPVSGLNLEPPGDRPLDKSPGEQPMKRVESRDPETQQSNMVGKEEGVTERIKKSKSRRVIRPPERLM